MSHSGTADGLDHSGLRHVLCVDRGSGRRRGTFHSRNDQQFLDRRPERQNPSIKDSACAATVQPAVTHNWRNNIVTCEVLSRQNGIGYLVLKDGSSKLVEWEVELLRDGSIGNGCIRGDKKHSEAAADDGCAILRLSAKISAAIAIDNYEHGEASFTTLLVSSTPSVFRAQTIRGSSTILDGDQFSIEFVGADGESLLVIAPTVIVRDYLPVLQSAIPPRSATSASTAFFGLAETWGTGTCHSTHLSG